MAWALVQTVKSFDDGAAATTQAATLATTASGSLIIVTVACTQPASPNTVTVAASPAGLTFAQEGKVSNNSDGYEVTKFSAYNSGAAAYIVTATINTAQQFRRIIVEEFSGGLTSSNPFDKTASQDQRNPVSTSTDGVTSTSTAATTTDGQLIHGSSTNVGTATTITQGTGFTAGTLNYNGNNTEYKTQSTAAAVAATFTTNVSPANAEYTIVTTYKAAGGPVTTGLSGSAITPGSGTPVPNFQIAL